jgi:hypothetical protein
MTPSTKRPRRPLPEAAVVKEDKGLETRLADSPGGMIPEAGEPLEGMSAVEPESVPYRKLIHWGWYVVLVAPRQVNGSKKELFYRVASVRETSGSSRPS